MCYFPKGLNNPGWGGIHKITQTLGGGFHFSIKNLGWGNHFSKQNLGGGLHTFVVEKFKSPAPPLS